MITTLDYFRRCIDLYPQHGYGRIAVGNQYLVAWADSISTMSLVPWQMLWMPSHGH